MVAPSGSPGPLTAITACSCGKTVDAYTANEWRLPAAVHDACPVPWVNVCPVLASPMFSRAVGPMSCPETPGIRRSVVSRDSDPTVTATPTVTCATMTALADALPFEPICTDRGIAAASAVIPDRYWPGGVPAGTRTMNPSLSPVPPGSETSPGRPDTQQPGPEQLWNDRLNALPPLPAVTPVARPTLSRSACCPSLLISAVPAAESPGATVIMKYGAAYPALSGAGVRPNCPLPPAPAAGAGSTGTTVTSAATTAATATP